MHHQNFKYLLEKVLKKMKILKRKVTAKTTMMIERKWLAIKGPTKFFKVTNRDNKQITKRRQTASRYRPTCIRWTWTSATTLRACASLHYLLLKSSKRSPIETISTKGRQLQSKDQTSWLTSSKTTHLKTWVTTQPLLKRSIPKKALKPKPSATRRIWRPSRKSELLSTSLGTITLETDETY